ncbi:MAG: hypothetical protein ACLGHN_08985 [Bacteriovoracia bacterium]
MLKIHALLFTLLFSFNSLAGSLDVFMATFKNDYFFNQTTRGKELHYHVRITPFNWIMRRLNPDAIATYNDKLNIISLNEELLLKVEGKTTIKSAKDMPSYKISTIFHEMGHAELDVFIENETDAGDQELKRYYETVMKSFYRKYFPKFSPKMMFHEHFGYYRGDLVEVINSNHEDILLQNGFNRFRNTCFATPALKKLVKDGILLEDFKKFLVMVPEKKFKDQVAPGYIYIKGKDIHLHAQHVPQEGIKSIESMFWKYHKTFYDFPTSNIQLVERMNQRSILRTKLAECREKMWKELKQ